MSTDLAKTGASSTALPHHAVLTEEDAIPRLEVEVVTEEEKRQEEQLRPRARVPANVFRSSEDPPLVQGAEVDCEVLLGFLSAFEEISTRESFHTILSSAKLSYQIDTEAPPRLLVEAVGADLWAMATLEAKAKGQEGFIALVPLRRTVNVLKGLRDRYRQVVVGVDSIGVGIGPHRVPFAGMVSNFPGQPAIRDWEVRAAMPASYIDEICTRVVSISMPDPTDPGMHGVLLDLRSTGDGQLVCTAVASDGQRLHCLAMPQMVVETRFENVRPPSVMVPAGFFRYLRAMVNREWAAIEISEEQVLGRGQDFVVEARAAMRGHITLNEATHWQNIGLEYRGCWLVDKTRLVDLVTEAEASAHSGEVCLEIDAMKERMVVYAWGDDGNYKQDMTASRAGGPAAVEVFLNSAYLLDAIHACRGGLIRLSFPEGVDAQQSSQVVVQGEDDLFKAVMMPLVDE